jgi:amino acid adenylation domain-containing protein
VQAGPHFIEFAVDEVERSVPERFEQQASLHAHRIAVKTKTRQVTYREFNESANQIARTINQRSSRDKPVALLLDHDLPAILSMFAALKAGRSFVPLDPSLPPSRLEYMLKDSRADMVVTNNQRLALADELFDNDRIIDIDQIDTSLETGNLEISISPDNMSCILYTSGITGRPKGVMHTHCNELHNVMHHTNSLHLSSDDRLTLLGSYSTGQGMQDLYCALLNGARLYPWSLKVDGLSGLAEWLIKERITIYHSAATVFRYLIRTLSGREEFPDLRVIRLGSEYVFWKDVEAYKRHFSKQCVFVNALSSSETKTIRQYVINKETQVSGLVPVGYAVADTKILLLDELGNQLGPGRVGEIAVRSRFLSPGYWRDPDTTNAAYVSDLSCPENRLFQTGEWGRMSADGCLEHLGRRDTQVKIRGYRVETYETELALLRHPAVDQVLVLCRENKNADKYLIAYTTICRSPAPTVSALRSFLSDKIPEYMIPSAFVFLESFPLTQNGKVDHGALPEPHTARPALDNPFVTPTSPIEQILAQIWAEVLGIDEIGVQDNHFDLGGNSLTAMQVVAQAGKQFQVPLSLQQFFESPTIADLSRAILTAFGPTAAVNNLRIESAQRDEFLPLSFAQQRLWFLDQWEPGSAVYNICRAYRLRGKLDVGAMGQSLNTVVQRHEVLRTCFPAIDGQPRQVIASSLNVPILLIDLHELPEAERYEKSLQLATEDARQPFDLARGPMLRAKLVRLADNEHIFVFTVHQIVCDGWSMQVLHREFWTIYDALTKDISLALPALPLQYADFAIWQRQWMQDSVLQSQITYWKKQFGEAWPLLNLPADRPRPVQRGFRGSRQAVVLPESLTEAVRDLMRQEGVTLFMTLVTAFQTLLHRYVEETDLVVGFPIANRNWTETARIVGFFVNTLVLRTDFSGAPCFRDLLFKVRESCLGAYANQDLPFDKLIEELRPPRDVAHNPMFQAMFVLQIAENSSIGVQGIVSEPVEIDAGTSKFDLTLSLAERHKRLVGIIEFSTDLFDRSTIERMAGHYRTLLGGIVADPNRSISELPILTEAERQQLLIEWNDTESDYPKDKCISQLFEEQAASTPDAIAVSFEEQQLTYRELNTRANQLASYLINLGVGPEKLVGICVERSREMVVGLLGILKTGAAYVPVDPSYPKKRLAFMVNDARVSVVVTQENLIDSTQYSALSTQRFHVCLDRDWAVIQRQNAENPQTEIRAEGLAYVIYTSGSAGKPKGVQVSHRSLVNCLYSIGERLGFTNGDVFLALTTISFDISVLELFLPLITGGKVVVASREEAADGRELARRLKRSSATALQATPSTWRLLIEAGWEGSPGFKILCGGELMPRDLAEALLTRGEVWNLYGPTESTIWSSMHKVESGEEPVPIGRPIANTTIYILDSHLQPVPIGVHGELSIDGNGLARGYWNQPELTAEKFIPNPFEAGERLYKTGDRARFRPDGNIEFIGRIDNQVKIRGYRVELGEIEATLNQHPAVKDSVLVARARGSLTEDTLVAYVVPKQQAAPSISELRDYLKEKLPEYMIPSVFVMLDSLPLTPSGKIDRSALPAADGTRPNLAHEFVGPRTEIEDLVAQVWREVLKLDRIGVHDNFFELGGHSLLATRVVARLRNNFSIDLALRKLFELPTVVALAEHIDGLLHNQSGTTAMGIVPAPRDRVQPASFSQQRLWFLRELDPESTAYNISAVFSIRGVLNVSALEEAFNAIIARHEILRTIFDVTEGTVVQTIQPSLRISLPILDFGSLAENAWNAAGREVALDEARQPFDLREGPLLRAKLLQSGEERYYLLLNFDHAVLDGWSMGTFFKELGILYGAFASGQPNPLPPLPLQYADYAVWQRECFHGDVSESQLEYWKRQLGDRLTPLSLPTDYPRPALQTSRGIRKTLALSKQLSDSLKELSRREGVTLFMTLLAGFKILLSRHSGQDNILIGATIAGRSRPEIEGLIGFFINALPLRTDLSGKPSFLELLKRVREVCLGAYTHQDAPFERIVEAINPHRDFSRNPLFQIMFNMADVSERVLRLNGCEVRKESFFDPEAKFDITLYAPEKDGVIELAIVYNADLFVESRMTAMLDQFAYLLAQIAEKPQAKIDEYSLVLPSTRALLPDPTESLDDRWEGAIHELFSERARITPEKLAVLDPDDTWTYRELDQHSAQLANYLIANGIQPKDVVGIYAHRSCSLVLALMGVLKAGATFVILDPAYPAPRLIEYLWIAQPRGWVQMNAAGEPPQELAAFLDSLEVSCRIKLPSSNEKIRDILSKHSEIEPGVPTDADDPAYVAFTSGSTGQPKGVLCRHGPITHFLPWQQETFDLSMTDRFSLLSGLAYNHLHRDIFTALALGATLYIPPPEFLKSPERLMEWLVKHEITILHLTPALGRLLRTATAKNLPAIRRIFFGGDVLTREEVVLTRELAPYAKIVSFYGATETQRAVGYFEMPEETLTVQGTASQPIPLGRGIKDVQLLLLTTSGRLAGVGELAELYVRSPHLAQGYLGDSTLTAQNFIANPFTNEVTDRLYRTGELGRYLPDGNVEWVGRKDRQVSIRGFRVEPAEVETVLNQHPKVRQSAVVAQDEGELRAENRKSTMENRKFDTCLVAYIESEQDQLISIDELRCFLNARLPDYMVPSYFLFVDHLPLSPNGKVDYLALSPPSQILRTVEYQFEAPRTEMEQTLGRIFSEVLCLERIGLQDNFFHIGGHSLLAAQIAARVRENLNVALDLRDFLETPTVADLARKVELLVHLLQTTSESDTEGREEILI